MAYTFFNVRSKLVKKNILISVCLMTAFSIAGCATPPKKEDYSVIPALPATTASNAKNAIRIKAIQDTALSVGAQGGLAWQSQKIDDMLDQDEDELNQVFNFAPLILKDNVLPPVLVEGDTTLNLASPYAIRLADKVYKIEQPPRFVTVPPTWRDYLWQDFEKPAPPNATLLPKTDEERAVWNEYVKEGWAAGVSQANQIFSINLGRLKRDYKGMILYRKLLAENMVTPPYVAKVNLGVTGGGNLMRINDQVLRITATSQLNPNAKTWKPVITPGEAGGENQIEDQINP